MMAWREFDVIRAVYQNQPVKPRLKKRVANRLRRILQGPPRFPKEHRFTRRERQDIIQELFCGRGLLPIMGEDKRAQAAALDISDAESFLDGLQALGDYSLQSDELPPLEPRRFNNTLGASNSRRADLLHFITQVRDTEELDKVPNFYFDYLAGLATEDARIVLKAADQIMCFEQLAACSPDSTKIVIMRDGRDATISAMHYGKLMEKWDAPWKPDQVQYLDRLRAWAVRAAKLVELSKTYNILVLRYEDLQRDFDSVCGGLLQHLGVNSDPQLVRNIYQRTNFKKVSGGREPGQSAEDIIRKGVIGEWKDTLSANEAKEAWQVAGPELEQFGYTREGHYKTSGLCPFSVTD